MAQSKEPGPAEKAAAHARKLLKEELARLSELHEPPMPPQSPVIQLPAERRQSQRATSPEMRVRGRRKTDQPRGSHFIV